MLKFRQLRTALADAKGFQGCKSHAKSIEFASLVRQAMGIGCGGCFGAPKTEARLVSATFQDAEEPLNAYRQVPAFVTFDLQWIVANGAAARKHEQSDGRNKTFAHLLAVADQAEPLPLSTREADICPSSQQSGVLL